MKQYTLIYYINFWILYKTFEESILQIKVNTKFIQKLKRLNLLIYKQFKFILIKIKYIKIRE